VEYEVFLGRRDYVRGEGRKEGGKRNVGIDGRFLKRSGRD
jgi:hypothetical protein